MGLSTRRGKVSVPYTILHRGVPLATVEQLDLDAELTAANLRPLPAYEVIRPVARAATDAMRNLGYLGPVADPAPDVRRREALAMAAALARELELRDAHDRVIPTDFIDVGDWPGTATPVFAWIGIRHEHGGMPAREQPRPTSAPGHDELEA